MSTPSASVAISIEFYDEPGAENIDDAYTVTSNDIRFSVAEELRSIADRLDPS